MWLFFTWVGLSSKNVKMSSVVVQRHKRKTVNATDCGFDFISSVYGIEAKSDIEFRHIIRISLKFGNKCKGIVLMEAECLSTRFH